jgi:hypothetical protein
VNEILKKYLLEVAPVDLDSGCDLQVLDLCIQDLRNYLAYLEGITNEPNVKFCTYVRGKVLGEYFEEFADEELDKELDIFLREWVTMWHKKFQERTELSIKKEFPKDALKIAINGRNTLVAYFSKKERQELEQYVMDILYNAGEYCGTSFLCHSLIEQYLGRDTWQKKKVFTTADKLEFMHIVGMEAKRMAYTRAKLIFMRADFKKFVSEWRESGSTSPPT